MALPAPAPLPPPTALNPPPYSDIDPWPYHAGDAPGLFRIEYVPLDAPPPHEVARPVPGSAGLALLPERLGRTAAEGHARAFVARCGRRMHDWEAELLFMAWPRTLGVHLVRVGANGPVSAFVRVHA